jgi:hypothetical protein
MVVRVFCLAAATGRFFAGGMGGLAGESLPVIGVYITRS